MENPHHHRNHAFHRFLSSSCRFNSINNVVESSIVSQNPKKNIQPFQSKHHTSEKQSYGSNSRLFSSKNDDENDDCFSLSSNSSRSSSQNISNIRPKMGFSSLKKGDIEFSGTGHSSSSEASTSSSVNSYNPLEKDENPRQRITLAEQFRNQNIHYKKGKTEHLCFDSSVSCQKKGKIRQTTRASESICSSSSESCHKSGEIIESGLKTGELQRITAKKFPLFIGGKIEDSYAVEKESRDPYEDFLESMVEMIVEKKIEGALDLEKLLLCFLTLNSSVYHRIILDAFSEICEALFGK